MEKDEGKKYLLVFLGVFSTVLAIGTFLISVEIPNNNLWLQLALLVLPFLLSALIGYIVGKFLVILWVRIFGDTAYKLRHYIEPVIPIIFVLGVILLNMYLRGKLDPILTGIFS